MRIGRNKMGYDKNKMFNAFLKISIIYIIIKKKIETPSYFVEL